MFAQKLFTITIKYSLIYIIGFYSRKIRKSYIFHNDNDFGFKIHFPSLLWVSGENLNLKVSSVYFDYTLLLTRSLVTYD